MKARLLAHWRVSTFRLAIFFGVLFTLANIVLLSLIYWQTSVYLENRVDNSIYTMSSNFKNGDPIQVMAEMNDAMTYDLRKSSIFGLFTPQGKVITGNMHYLPPGLTADGEIHEFDYHANLSLTPQSGSQIRAIVRRLKNNEILVVGRDYTELTEIKIIIFNVLAVSGAVIMALGLLIGFGLSLGPLRRISAIKVASRRIVEGELSLRMPVSKRQDELDMLANIVNRMLDEIERLLNEVSSVTDTIAHDLRTPLTRLRLLLQRAQQQTSGESIPYRLLDNALTETDTLLAHFRALLRISDLENNRRKVGIVTIDAEGILFQIAELFEPLAEDKSIQFSVQSVSGALIHADPDLLFEAISNLVDNAIKFTPPGGKVSLRLIQENRISRIDIIDTGSGILPEEREFVFQRFYRGQQHRDSEGYGLGLSIVAAILHLHGYILKFQDSKVGTHISIYCNSAEWEFLS